MLESLKITRVVEVVRELLKYGGSGMIHRLFAVIWHEELVPPQWSEGLIVNLKGMRRTLVTIGV